MEAGRFEVGWSGRLRYSKQGNLATMLVFVRKTPRLRFNTVEPGVNLSTSLGRRDANAFVRLLTKTLAPVLIPLLLPFMKFLNSPKRAARVITNVLMNASGTTGVCRLPVFPAQHLGAPAFEIFVNREEMFNLEQEMTRHLGVTVDVAESRVASGVGQNLLVLHSLIQHFESANRTH